MTDRVIPFSTAAQAYSRTRPLAVRPVTQTPPAARQMPADTFDISALARAQTQPTHKLSAAKVPGPVTFDGAAPARAAGALPLYTHPADRNGAATSINAGRTIDTHA
jgi:hypothetical protein